MGVAIQRVRCALIVVGAAAVGAPVAAQSSPDPGKSVHAGVYTAEQAAQGETVFQNVCANCHASSQFRGAVFLKPWAGRAVYSLYDQIRTAMPQDNPGSLSRGEYLAVIAYILKLNGFPNGTAELPEDEAELRLIRLDTLSGANERTGR